MSDKWMINGTSLGSCNCDWGCPCQFNAPSTHGQCQFASGGYIEEGYFGDTSLTGLHWAEIGYWPGEISEGNGKLQIIIDEKANTDQRQALHSIMHGKSGAPGSNHFSVYSSTCTALFEPLYLPIDYAIDIEQRTGHVSIPEILHIQGSPIIDEFTGKPFRASIGRPSGSFEYTHAEMGNTSARTHGSIELTMDNSYGQFNRLHLNQDGLVTN